MLESYLSEILVRRGVVTEERLKPFFAQQRENGPSLMDLLLAGNVADGASVAQALADECGFPYVARIDIDAIPTPIASKLPISYAKQHKLLVANEDEQRVHVICADPLDTASLDDVRALFQKPVDISVTSAENVVDAINRVYEKNDQRGGDLQSKDEINAEDELEDILDSDEDAPIIRWVNALFFQGVKERASDIHIEPEEKEVVVRYRIDGELYVAKRANKQFMSSIIARVKIMAGLNIAEKRLPQDGRISLKIAGKSIDVRVSTIPTSRGFERIVMRLLHKTNVLLDLPDLGFAPRDYALMDSLIRKPDGIILVTGPTGSGKTTTLYAGLNRINHPNLNILTAEDPVEYEIGGIHQVHVHPKIGLTFASALRAFLRQDPDVIMVGEIRDKETAEIAIHASLTGHLVLSTIHTNDAAGAVTRLVEMEIEAFLVRSSVIGILAQRLVRMLCPECKEPYTPSDFELKQIGLDPERTAWRAARKFSPRYIAQGPNGNVIYDPIQIDPKKPPTFFRAKGCATCLQTGYAGRRGIYELLMIEDVVGGLILKNADAQSIKRAAVEQGMDTLRDDGARKVLKGMTTVEEVLAATQEDVAVE
ncbi:MAG: type II secretion system ATPase GspE [Polyangiaceae bacterium]